MTGRPRVLWVAGEAPDPELGGGGIRQYQMLRHLSRHARIDLLLVGELRDGSVRDFVEQATVLPRPPTPGFGPGPVGSARRRAGNLASFVPGTRPSEVRLNRRVAAALRSARPPTGPYDLVHVEHEDMAGVMPWPHTGRWAMTLQNLISVRARHRAARAGKERVKWLHSADARRAERWERRIKSRFDVTITVSEQDDAAMGGGTVVIPNGVDLEKFSACPLPEAPRLLFSASFNYEPNADAAVWLCREVLPRVRLEVPAATVVLVGREPGPRVRELAALEGVEGHFDVESVVPYLRGARVSLAPLREGSGTRLKALEAMASARPVAGTTIGLEGLPLEHGRSAVVADDADALAAGIARLCTDEGLASGMASAGRQLAEARYGWDRSVEIYLERVLRAPPDRNTASTNLSPMSGQA